MELNLTQEEGDILAQGNKGAKLSGLQGQKLGVEV